MFLSETIFYSGWTVHAFQNVKYEYIKQG